MTIEYKQVDSKTDTPAR